MGNAYCIIDSEELGRAIDRDPRNEALWAEHRRRIQEGMKLNRFIDGLCAGDRITNHVALKTSTPGWCRFEVIGTQDGDPCFLSRKLHHIKVRRVTVDGDVQKTVQIMPAAWFIPPGFSLL